eukprot:NODE_19751_length_829_cov_2.937322.p1 GENE.NODE_19751_length_829_cov_2.937322~~NODE_19751_length_829_cov_2.937322.p1  ORF type:complete len:237 (-),score=37.55 NODE_19751_length_829_cov_2.937322:24-734(-)
MADTEEEEEELKVETWRELGLQAQAAVRDRDWAEADRLAEKFCSLRPEWPKGYLLRKHAMRRLGRAPADVVAMLRSGLEACGAGSAETSAPTARRKHRFRELETGPRAIVSYFPCAKNDRGHGDATWQVEGRWALRQTSINQHISDSSNPSAADGSIYSVFDLDAPLGSEHKPLKDWRFYTTRSRGGSSGPGYGKVVLQADEAIATSRNEVTRTNNTEAFDLLAAVLQAIPVQPIT